MNRDYFLKTNRLGFSKWTDQDTRLAQLLWGDPQVTRYICASGIFRPSDIEAQLHLEIANEAEYHVQYWPFFDLASGSFIGCCGLRPRSAGEY